MPRSYAAARPDLITSEVIAAHPADREDRRMSAHRILQLNAVTTAVLIAVTTIVVDGFALVQYRAARIAR